MTSGYTEAQSWLWFAPPIPRRNRRKPWRRPHARPGRATRFQSTGAAPHLTIAPCTGVFRRRAPIHKDPGLRSKIPPRTWLPARPRPDRGFRRPHRDPAALRIAPPVVLRRRRSLAPRRVRWVPWPARHRRGTRHRRNPSSPDSAVHVSGPGLPRRHIPGIRRHRNRPKHPSIPTPSRPRATARATWLRRQSVRNKDL